MRDKRRRQDSMYSNGIFDTFARNILDRKGDLYTTKNDTCWFIEK